MSTQVNEIKQASKLYKGWKLEINLDIWNDKEMRGMLPDEREPAEEPGTSQSENPEGPVKQL